MHDVAKKYIDDIQVRKRALMDELKELRTLEKVIRAGGVSAQAKRPVASPEEPTLKVMIVRVLGSLDRGAEALEIVREIKSVFGKTVKRSSLSPQLSRLKKDGALVLDDKIWYLPHQYKEYEDKVLRDLGIIDANIIDRHVEEGAVTRAGIASPSEMRTSALTASRDARNAQLGLPIGSKARSAILKNWSE